MNTSFFTFILNLFLLFSSSTTYAQIQPLSLHDKIPELKFSNLVNANSLSFSISQFKDKCIIIDFWHTQCGGCIKKMPLMAKLQERFRKEVQIIMVTWEDREDVEKFYKTRPELKALGLPTVTEDSVLKKYFPYSSNPHIAWINRDKKVVAITGGEYFNEENLIKLLNNNTLSLPLKDDWRSFVYDSPQPLLVNGSQIVNELLSSSTLTRGLNNLKSRIGFTVIDSLNTKVSGTNQRLVYLYSFAYSKQIKFTNSNWSDKVILKISDSTAFFEGSDLQKMRIYCYELLPLPKNGRALMREEILNFMQHDLDRLFGFHSYVDSIKQECFIITSKDLENDLHSDTGYQVIEDLKTVKFQNVPVKIFLNSMKSSYNFDLPLMYEGTEKVRVNGEIQKYYNSFEEAKSVLEKFGFSLKKSFRLMPFLIIEDAIEKQTIRK